MARTKQTARKSTGGKAPRKLLNNGINSLDVVEDPHADAEVEAERAAIAKGNMRAELKHIDKKFTEEGQSYYTETVHEEIPEQIDWWSNFALCLVRHINQFDKKSVDRVCLEINSQHLKDILKEVVPFFPGVSFHTKNVTLDAPYRVLFHYRKEIEAAGQDLEEDSEAADHLDLLLDFINEEFKDVIAETDNLLEQELISFQHLWTIFRPGCTLYAPVFGQPRAFIVKSYSYVYQPDGLVLQAEFVDFDGTAFGHRQTNRFIPAFSGTRPIHELSAFPMDWHKDQAAIQRQLIQRGRFFETQAGINFHCYKGIALDTLHDDCKVVRYDISGRIVVDTKTFHRLNADHSYNVIPLHSGDDDNRINAYNDQAETLELLPENKEKFEPLTEEECMLASATVRGFSFTEKRWLDFFLDKLSPPGWDACAFDQLVLPDAQKDLVRSLVATHSQQKGGFDDIVKGKGMGLIMVLHGPPGVGKTLTAESTAELTERPLYSVSSGDLGTSSTTLDQRLSRILDMASTWNAVLLIDEADIFLEARSLHDLERNSLVSIFLRVLEYYEGILFLTSNRVATFDAAFKSRIHVPLKYGDLSFESRKKIWANFLKKVGKGVEGGEEVVGVDVKEGEIEVLAKAEINGRQIKNVIRTAKSLAVYHKKKLDCEMLLQVVKIQMDFEDELDGLMEVDKRGLGGRMVLVNGQ